MSDVRLTGYFRLFRYLSVCDKFIFMISIYKTHGMISGHNFHKTGFR
jgi:hypothetical protein